jgi:hypothetical protein
VGASYKPLGSPHAFVLLSFSQILNYPWFDLIIAQNLMWKDKKASWLHI